ncbi:MAG: glycerate kinase [Bacteroidota bacterium]
MKILLAPDKFKGSLSAEEVCEALGKGLKKVQPDVELIIRPLADGGDGSLDILGHYFELETHVCEVQDPLGRSISASYNMAQGVAYIEMSKASGLVLLKAEERTAMKTSSFGTGQLIRDALDKGAKEVYLFIGGSATNDGGTGIAQALGYRFLDAEGNEVEAIGEKLIDIDRIDGSQVLEELREISVKVICDVNNPFYGPHGAAYVYAAQKGASPEEIAFLDKGLEHLAEKLVSQGYVDVNTVPGAGAAGGVGGGSIAFLNAELIAGIEMFLQISELEKWVKASDLIITGEGKMDAQTEHGKVVSGVSQLAQKYRKPVIGVCGVADEGVAEKLKLNKVHTIMSRSQSIEEAMSKAAQKLEEIGELILSNSQ